MAKASDSHGGMGQNLIDFFNYYATTPASEMVSDVAGVPEVLANAAGLSVNPEITLEERQNYIRDDPDAERFRTTVEEVFNNRPLRKSAVTGELVSLRQSIIDDHRKLLPNLEKWEQMYLGNKKADRVLRYFQGEVGPEDAGGEYLNRFSGQLLDDIQELTPTKKIDPKSAVTDLTYDEWQRESRRNPQGVEDSYRLNEAGQKQWQVQRDYDILRTVMDGKHAPPYARGTAPIYQALGTQLGPILNPAITYFNTMGQAADALVEGLATGDFGPLSSVSYPDNFEKIRQSQADTNRLFSEGVSNGMLGRIRQGLYWYDRSKDADTTENSIEGANFPDRSMTTPTGMSDFYSNYGNFYTRFSSPLQVLAYNPEKIPSEIMGGSDLQNIQDLRNRVSRDTPVIPDESFRDSVLPAREAAGSQEMAQNAWATNNYARIPYALNQYFGTEFTPSFMSPAAETGIDLVREVFSDPFSAAQLPFAASRGPVSLARHVLGEMKEEGLPEYALSAAEYSGQVPQEELDPNTLSWMFAPSKQNQYMTNPDGTPFEFSGSPTDNTAYKKALARYDKTRQTFQSEVNKFATKMRKATSPLGRF